MKKNTHINRIIGLIFTFVFLISEVSGAEYKGDQYRSPVLRFLYSLFMGGSGKSTQFHKTTQAGVYHYSTLQEGNSQSGVSVSSSSALANVASPSLTSLHYTSRSSSQSSSFNKATSYAVNTDKSTGLSESQSSSAGNLQGASSSQSSADVSASGSSNLILSTPVSRRGGSAGVAASGSSSNPLDAGSPLGPTTPNGGGQGGDGGTTGAGSGGNGFSGPPADPQVATPIGDGALVLLSLAVVYFFFIRKRISRKLYA